MDIRTEPKKIKMITSAEGSIKPKLCIPFFGF